MERVCLYRLLCRLSRSQQNTFTVRNYHGDTAVTGINFVLVSCGLVFVTSASASDTRSLSASSPTYSCKLKS